jgi:aryl-alcohol dehydrogenase-like predicted oxidoreductase
VPIPGTKRRGYLSDNLGAAKVALTETENRWLEEHFPVGAASGDRYNSLIMTTIDRS